LLISCGNDDKDGHVEYVNTEIYKMMQEVYLWNDYMPRNVDPSDYSSPAAYMEALRYTQYDRWSTVLTDDEFNQYFEEGQMIGHGFMVGLDASENFRIAFVYLGTEAAEKGVKRGWILSKINGTNVTISNFGTIMGRNEIGVTNNISFINENGETIAISLSKEELELTPVLHSEVIEQGADRIGYMVFQDFIESANDEMDEVFDSFMVDDINELIIDMRYNGGGSVSVAEHLIGWLLGKDFANEPFLYYQHNGLLSSLLDTIYMVPSKANGFGLDRIFFIGTVNTASASELIIKGVEPFIGSVMAGSPTHGKPVGMYAIPISDYVTLPVAFKYTNKNHDGDFYNGIPPTLPANDDITRDFGDPEESSLKAILNYIETGTIPSKSTKSTSFSSQYIDRKGPIGQFLRAY